LSLSTDRQQAPSFLPLATVTVGRNRDEVVEVFSGVTAASGTAVLDDIVCVRRGR